MTAPGQAATIRCRVIYHGRVQGVFFRATAAEIASRHPVSGFVRNLHDGTVELEAEGPTAAVEALLSDIAAQYTGHITQVERTTLAVQGGPCGFEIRY